VYVEDLAVSGLGRTRLAKSVHDAGWSAFVAMLQYKAAKHGRYFARIGRFEPTSQVCSQCGVKDGPKPLHVREWACGECGTVHDRDENAARNILAAGRADRLNASWSAGKTRTKAPAQRGEAGSPRKGRTTQAGILALQGEEYVKSASPTTSPWTDRNCSSPTSTCTAAPPRCASTCRC
jgi:putative transposase